MAQGKATGTTASFRGGMLEGGRTAHFGSYELSSLLCILARHHSLCLVKEDDVMLISVT